MRPGQPFNPKRRFSGMWFPTWLVRMDLTWAAKAVYARAANLADDDGWAGFKVQWMADELGIDDSTVKRSAATLAEAGLLEIERVTGRDRLAHRGNRYRFIWHPIMDDAPTAQNETRAERAGETRARRAGALSSTKGEEEVLGENPPVPMRSEWLPASVNRRDVTQRERDLCDEIICIFNGFARTDYTGAIDHRRMIVGRIREFPEMTSGDHAEVMRVAFMRPWWSGAPGPEVVYGKAGTFERAIQTAKALANGSVRHDAGSDRVAEANESLRQWAERSGGVAA